MLLAQSLAQNPPERRQAGASCQQPERAAMPVRIIVQGAPSQLPKTQPVSRLEQARRIAERARLAAIQMELQPGILARLWPANKAARCWAQPIAPGADRRYSARFSLAANVDVALSGSASRWPLTWPASRHGPGRTVPGSIHRRPGTGRPDASPRPGARGSGPPVRRCPPRRACSAPGRHDSCQHGNCMAHTNRPD